VVRRLRTLGQVALEAGDIGVAEKSFKQVVAKARYSEFRDPEDHVNLVAALIKKGDTAQAGGAIREMEKSLRGNPNLDACKAISVAMLHDAAGDAEAAARELDAAVGALRTTGALSGKLKIALVRSCLSKRMDRQASEVMLAAMNDVESGVSVQQAMNVFVKAGRSDLADGIGQQLKAQAQELLDVAAEKTNMGDLKGAVQSLLEALHVAPASLQVMIAVARGILRQIDELGWDHPLGEQCNTQIETVRKLDAAHPELAVLDEEYLAAKRKYGIST
jgi:tetratricopeptide (TPR) repeat protein